MVIRRKYRILGVVLKRIFSQKKNTPTAIARGAAIGTFIAFTPSVGFQMVPAVLLASLFKGNRILAVTMVWISNPFTVIPIYGLSFYIGRFLLPQLENASFAKIKNVIENFSFSQVANIGIDSLITIWVGSLVIAIPAGIVAYWIFYKMVSYYRQRKELSINELCIC